MTEYKSLIEKINQMAIDIASIKTKLDLLPPPPKRPCQWHEQLRKELDEHLKDHKEIRSDWQSSMINGAVDLAKTALIAAAGVAAGMIFSGAA